MKFEVSQVVCDTPVVIYFKCEEYACHACNFCIAEGTCIDN